MTHLKRFLIGGAVMGGITLFVAFCVFLPWLMIVLLAIGAAYAIGAIITDDSAGEF